MKKLLIFYSIVLIGLFVTFSMIDKGSDYTIERKLWNIVKLHTDISKDPEAVPEQAYAAIIDKYQKILTTYPDSKLISKVHLLLARFYLVKKDYENARIQYQYIIAKSQNNKGVAATMWAAIGRTYEAQDGWSGAHKVYQNIWRDYPKTKAGLRVPIYIANYYVKQNDFQNALEAYDKALIHYKKIASQNPDTPLEFQSLQYVTNCYYEQKRWEEALDTMGNILRKYMSLKAAPRKSVIILIKKINTLAAYQMKDYDKAIWLYQKIMSEKPGHPLNDYLKKIIDGFNELKEQGVDVSAQ